MTGFKKILERIGPYPYSPALLFLSLFLWFFSRYLPIMDNFHAGWARLEPFFAIVLHSVAPSFGVAAMSWLFRKYRRWSDENLLFYIIEITSIVFALRIIRLFAEKTDIWKNYIPKNAYLRTTWITLLASVIFGLILNAILNFAQKATIGRLKQANQLIGSLETERRILVEAEEVGRTQLASFLHDRIQSDLMNVSMTLKHVSFNDNAADQALVDSSIARLESMRLSDMRRIIEELTPNFDTAPLHSHMTDLALRHSSIFATNIHFKPEDGADALNNQLKLGIYRIVEQLLLNSLIHAECKSVDRSVTRKRRALHIEYTDYGIGTDLSGTKDGIGMAVINSWISVLGAQTVIDSQPGNGYSFKFLISI
jgi:signal transduction histidine kinase